MIATRGRGLKHRPADAAVTERLTTVDVRWPSFDEAGVERSSERSHGILRLGDDGQHRIQVALAMTAS